MSVLTYLQQRASDAVLSSGENASITTSITTLGSRLNSHFGATVTEHFRFGSSTRGTILPRSMDAQSDIDYMVVFGDAGYTPQTYLDRLKRFVERYYSRSEIYQSSPTIVLELNHIRFELVPALKGIWSSYQIPDGSAAWRSTDPNGFNAKLTAKNNAELSLIKPTIRLAKFWNATAGYVFESYGLEQWIVDQYYPYSSNQKQYLFQVFDLMSVYGLAQWKKDKVQRAKDIVVKVRQYEAGDMPYSAEAEVKKLIPA